MNRFVLGLILSALPPCLSAALGVEVKESKDVDGRHVVTVTAADADDDGVVAIGSGDGDGAGVVSFVVDVSDEGDGAADGRSERKKVIRLSQVGLAGDPNSGWLGVSIGVVSDSLSTQLNLNDRGVVIQNVVKDSPADQAGIQAHDIVLSIDGKEVGQDVGQAVSAIKDRAPGDIVNLMVLRNGVNIPISVTLGSRADMHGPHVAWRYKTGANAIVEDEVQTRGKIVTKDDQGNWIVKDLGSLDELDNLPADIRAMIPRSGTQTVTVESLGTNSTVNLNVNRDGSSISISQSDGGPITVTRTDAQGQSSTATYQTREELEANDVEAFDLLDQSGNVQTFTLKLDDLGNFGGAFDIDGMKWFGGDGQIDAEFHVQEGMEEAHEAYEEAMERAHELLEGLHGEGGLLGGGEPHVFSVGGDHKFHFKPFGHLSKPKHTFKAQADGTIEVRIRKGDSELVQVYANEADLQRRAPDLYEKYDELMSIEAE